MKFCSICKFCKPVNEFDKRKASLVDGLQPICILCKRTVDAQHYQNNSTKIIKQSNDNRLANPEKYNAYRRRLRKHKEATDINYKMRRRLRSRLYNALNGGHKAGSAIEDLGCSIEELTAHLEAQFKPGMTWENWDHKGWHIDHIQPLATFDLSNPEEVKKACHYTNLRPQWGRRNMSDGGRLRQSRLASSPSPC